MGMPKFARSQCRWEGDRMSKCKKTKKEAGGINNFHLRIRPKTRLTAKEYEQYERILRDNNWRATPVDPKWKKENNINKNIRKLPEKLKRHETIKKSQAKQREQNDKPLHCIPAIEEHLKRANTKEVTLIPIMEIIQDFAGIETRNNSGTNNGGTGLFPP